MDDECRFVIFLSAGRKEEKNKSKATVRTGGDWTPVLCAVWWQGTAHRRNYRRQVYLYQSSRDPEP